MRKKLFTALEVLIWTVLFLIPTLFISTILHPDLDIKKHYYADFKDVNGIIIGSPVNYIGYNVGHVDDVKILDDRVRVDIAIVKENYSLPKCSMIKVEESGIGGSRSLEISPCNDPLLKGSIYTKKPKRVSEMLDEYCVFTNSLIEGLGNFLNVLQVSLDNGKCCKLHSLKNQSISTQVELKETSAKLEAISAKAPANIQKTNNNLKKTLSSVQKVEIDPEKIKNSAKENHLGIEKLNKTINKYTAAEYREKAEKLYWKTEVITIIDKNKLQNDVTQLNNTLQSTQIILNKIETNLQSESLSKTREKIRTIKENSGDLIEKE